MGFLWWVFCFVLRQLFLLFFPDTLALCLFKELRTQILPIVLTNLKCYCLTYFLCSTDSNYHPYGSTNTGWRVNWGITHSRSCFFTHILFSAISVNMVCIFASQQVHLGMSQKQTNLSFIATAARGWYFPLKG